MFQQIVATVIMCLAFLLNTYKIPITLSTPYSIFPWVSIGSSIGLSIGSLNTNDQVISKSEPFWLFFHTIISLCLVFMAWYYVMKFRRNNILNKIYSFLHIVFVIMILYNRDNLGKLNVQRADIINLAGIILVSTTYIYNCYFGYLVILCMPVYLEFFALLNYFTN